MEKIGKTHDTPGSNQNRLALRGMGLFIRVSREAPANAFRQGRLIAEYCDKRGLSAQELGNALLQNETVLARVVTKANREHARSGADTGPIDLCQAQNMVTLGFAFAAGHQSRRLHMR